MGDDEKLTEAQLRKRRAAERRARILASSSERMAVVEGVADSKLVRAEMVETPAIPADSSFAEQPTKARYSYLGYDRLRQRVNTTYYVLLLALWVKFGLSADRVSSLQLVLIQATIGALFALIDYTLSHRIKEEVDLGNMIAFLSAAEILLRFRRFFGDIVNGLAVVIFIHVLQQQNLFYWGNLGNSASPAFAG